MYPESPIFRGRFRPSGIPRIDWSHPQAAGLAGCFILDGSIPFNLVTGEQATQTGTVTPINTPMGNSGAYLNPVSSPAGTRTNFHQVHNGVILGGTSTWSVVAGFTLNSSYGNSNSGWCIYSERPASGNEILKLGIGGVTLNGVGTNTNSVGVIYRNHAGTLLDNCLVDIETGDGNPHIVAVTKNGSSSSNNCFAYVDGQQTDAETWNTNDTFSSSGIKSYIGADAGDSTCGFPDTISFIFLYKVALTPAQVAQVTADPFAFLIWPQEDATQYVGVANAVSGNINTAESADTANVSGTALGGSIATTESADTSSASGIETITGTVSAAEHNDTSSASGGQAAGSGASTEGNDTSSASGLETILGTSTPTEATDIVAAFGTETITGSAAATEGNDSCNASASTIGGTVAATERGDSCSAQGQESFSGFANIFESNDSMVGEATLIIPVPCNATLSLQNNWNASLSASAKTLACLSAAQRSNTTLDESLATLAAISAMRRYNTVTMETKTDA